MHMKLNTQPFSNSSNTKNSASLAEAKAWIGRQLVLRKPWLGFSAGTPCKVMCVVDFGDGLLLWIVTDHAHSQDIDQLEISCVSELFGPRHAASSFQHQPASTVSEMAY